MSKAFVYKLKVHVNKTCELYIVIIINWQSNIRLGNDNITYELTSLKLIGIKVASIN